MCVSDLINIVTMLHVFTKEGNKEWDNFGTVHYAHKYCLVKQDFTSTMK